ncbi:MAG TPA: hypothetical protein VF957_13475, partial [Bradyrhizobium sp.]
PTKPIVSSAIASLPVAPHEASALLFLDTVARPFGPNVQIVSQSVKHKIAIDTRRPAGIGFEKQLPRNSLSAAG